MYYMEHQEITEQEAIVFSNFATKYRDYEGTL